MSDIPRLGMSDCGACPVGWRLMLRWVQGLAALPCCRALASRLQHQLAKLDLLLLDELGYVTTSKTGAELLFDVIVTAYERSSLFGHHQPAVRDLDRSPRQRA